MLITGNITIDNCYCIGSNGYEYGGGLLLYSNGTGSLINITGEF